MHLVLELYLSATPHNFAEPSLWPLKMDFPSGEKQHEFTALECASMVRWSWPVVAVQSLRVVSDEPLTMVRPVGEKAQEYTEPVWP